MGRDSREDSINSLLAYALYVMLSLASLNKGVADCTLTMGSVLWLSWEKEGG